MPSKNSKKGHLPERSCVICRKKNLKEKLIRFVVIKNQVVFDLNNKIWQRGYYVCNNNNCIKKLEKWIKKQKKKRLKI